jgi:hypothetical protein
MKNWKGRARSGKVQKQHESDDLIAPLCSIGRVISDWSPAEKMRSAGVARRTARRATPANAW